MKRENAENRTYMSPEMCVHSYHVCPQLGAESADSIGAVLNSKEELKEIEETRETCRWVDVYSPETNRKVLSKQAINNVEEGGGTVVQHTVVSDCNLLSVPKYKYCPEACKKPKRAAQAFSEY